MIWLKLLSNPITRIIADKTIGAIQHSLDKKKIIRRAEIEASKTISIEQIKASQSSWKDEWITFIFTTLIVCHFIPPLQPAMSAGWEVLSKADEKFWYVILLIVSGSFGINTINKFRNGKK